MRMIVRLGLRMLLPMIQASGTCRVGYAAKAVAGSPEEAVR